MQNCDFLWPVHIWCKFHCKIPVEKWFSQGGFHGTPPWALTGVKVPRLIRGARYYLVYDFFYLFFKNEQYRSLKATVSSRWDWLCLPCLVQPLNWLQMLECCNFWNTERCTSDRNRQIPPIEYSAISQNSYMHCSTQHPVRLLSTLQSG